MLVSTQAIRKGWRLNAGADSAPWRTAECHLVSTRLPRPTCAGTHAGSARTSISHPSTRSSLPLRKGAPGQAQVGGALPGPGHTHVVEEGAGIDGDAEALDAHPAGAQAVQHVGHSAHDALHHWLAVLEEAMEEGRQLSVEQASLGVAGAVGRGLQDLTPTLLVGPRTI